MLSSGAGAGGPQPTTRLSLGHRRPWLALLGSALALLCIPNVAHAAAMSNETFSRILLLLCAVGAGYVVTHLVLERLSPRLAVGGVEYLVLGVVLGPVLGIINPDLARDIRPALSLGAGALGMLVGLEISTPEPKVRGAWLAAGTIVLMTGVAIIVLPLLIAIALGFNLGGELPWAVTLMAAGVVVLGGEGAAVVSMAESLTARGTAPRNGLAVAQRTQVIAVILFGVLFAVLPRGSDLLAGDPIGAAQALTVQVAAGVVLGALLTLIVPRRLEDRVMLTVLVGMVCLAGGVAYAMGVSVIFVNFVTGLVFARLSREAPEITRMLTNIKRPFVVALFFFAGLEWVTGTPWAFALIVPFMILHRVGRRVGGVLSSRFMKPSLDVSPATLAPGGLSVAFILTLWLLYPETPGMRDAYAPLLVAVVLLELWAARSIRKWLLDVADVLPEGQSRP